MSTFGWVGGVSEPPVTWDLRLLGWSLCGDLGGPRGRHVILADAGQLDRTKRGSLAAADAGPCRTIMLGVQDGAERARLLRLGCAEVLPREVALGELEARARRIADQGQLLPRCRRVGPIVLDLFHRDARSGPTWLGLHPREFGLLWRLADVPGEAAPAANCCATSGASHRSPTPTAWKCMSHA